MKKVASIFVFLCLTVFSNPAHAIPPVLFIDSDGDGVSNLIELYFGTDPFDPTDHEVKEEQNEIKPVSLAPISIADSGIGG